MQGGCLSPEPPPPLQHGDVGRFLANHHRREDVGPVPGDQRTPASGCLQHSLGVPAARGQGFQRPPHRPKGRCLIAFTYPFIEPMETPPQFNIPQLLVYFQPTSVYLQISQETCVSLRFQSYILCKHWVFLCKVILHAELFP